MLCVVVIHLSFKTSSEVIPCDDNLLIMLLVDKTNMRQEYFVTIGVQLYHCHIIRKCHWQMLMSCVVNGRECGGVCCGGVCCGGGGWLPHQLSVEMLCMGGIFSQGALHHDEHQTGWNGAIHV